MEEKKEEKKESKIKFFDLELKIILIFTCVGIITGYVSFLINSPLRNLILTLAILAGITLATKKIFRVKESIKWWFKPAIIYLFIWLIVWTIFYNTKIL